MSHYNLPSGNSVIVFYLFLPEEEKKSVYLVYMFDKSCLFRNNRSSDTYSFAKKVHMNITVIFWAFRDLSSVGGMIEKLKSLIT